MICHIINTISCIVSVAYVFGEEVLNVRKGRTGPKFGL